jgi:hypothetical protein
LEGTNALQERPQDTNDDSKASKGELPITSKQAIELEVAPSSQLSPYLETCCLRVSANVSYEDAASDIEYFTGVHISRSSQQRLVHRQKFELPRQEHTVEELSVDGGNIRIRTQSGEVLDWFHLMENLHKVGGSQKRLKQAQTLLWKGQVEPTKALFADCKGKQAQNFCHYLDKHSDRIINYEYHQAEQICSIGSGSVESAVKQIDRRTKISGAQWKRENVPQVLAHRAAYEGLPRTKMGQA